MIRLLRRERRPGIPDVTLSVSVPNIVIRPPRSGDLPQWIEVRGRNRNFLKPYEPSWPEDCLTEDFFSRRLARQARDWAQDRGYAFLIFEKRSQNLVGGININNVSRGAAQYATLGYWLDEQAQGKGYMTAGLAAVIDFAFKKLGLHRINAGCLPDNERSAKLLLRLGFAEEGFAQKYVCIDGVWQDHRLFGLPVENWRGLRFTAGV